MILDKLQRDYFDKGKGVVGYWRFIEESFIPEVEENCQNLLDLSVCLLSEKFGHHIVINREYPIAGNREDFHFSVNYKDKNLAVPIEIKVAHERKTRKWLIEPVKTQLLEKYMKPSHLEYGVFIALWFKCNDFDHPKTWKSKENYISELTKFCKKVSKDHSVYIQPIVLDLTSELPKASKKAKKKG